ncbi:hypothetical protein SDC9_141611 [bioreactor metagenome]|uniref:Uncharacterized protein n=1 Tax=bioreactor metagenome TaxID=1076179 RepID=A0A645DYR2_9ZZZZ
MIALRVDPEIERNFVQRLPGFQLGPLGVLIGKIDRRDDRPRRVLPGRHIQQPVVMQPGRNRQQRRGNRPDHDQRENAGRGRPFQCGEEFLRIETPPRNDQSFALKLAPGAEPIPEISQGFDHSFSPPPSPVPL